MAKWIVIDQWQKAHMVEAGSSNMALMMVAGSMSVRVAQEFEIAQHEEAKKKEEGRTSEPSS